MKLQIKFFADLYDFLIKDYKFSLNQNNKIKLPYYLFKKLEQIHFVLQNIHILDLPYLKSSSVKAINKILNLYLLKFKKGADIYIPKFEYHIKKDEFLGQAIIEKALHTPITESKDSYVIFKDYSKQECEKLIKQGNNLGCFRWKMGKEITDLFNFINQFFCISASKLSYCLLDFMNKFADQNFDKGDLMMFCYNEIDIKLNYVDIVSNCQDFNSYINSPKIAYNRLTVIYHNIFKQLSTSQLSKLLEVFSNDNNLVKLLLSNPCDLNLDTVELYIKWNGLPAHDIEASTMGNSAQSGNYSDNI
ncbi:MAG TPA: hypothetical protein LFW21_04780 [Rickettsia endosymbiont of Pyrocoelia pectoralis]|nr:hypothetical protein [Rickettsia endosymbiont of Pyrocoelia pectoralis]